MKPGGSAMIRVWCALVGLMLFAPTIGGAQTPKQIFSVTDVTVTGSATLIKAANFDRTSLSCTNTGLVNVRWGDSTITNTKGQQLKSGLSIEIRNTGPVYMISEGANTTVACTEETR